MLHKGMQQLKNTAKQNIYGQCLYNTMLRKLPSALQKDEEYIRCRRRLKNEPMDYDGKYPIILPKSSRFTELVVKHYHKLVLHNVVR